MSPSQGASAPEVGPKLIEMGCRQGALIRAPARMLWLTRVGNEQAWITKEDNLDDAQLVVVSQDCDIYAPLRAEPRVEAMTARWTENPSEIHIARKGNSARLFLLQEAQGKGFVADARRRVHLDKNALLGVPFEPAFNDPRTHMRFARWVAGRYNRPAIANELVDAVQKPLVSAVDALASKDDAFLRVLDRVAELRFSVSNDQPPWTAHLIAMLDEGEELSAEEEAELGGWLEDVLVAGGTGSVRDIALAFRTEGNISLRDYLHTIHLQLDQFSPEDGAGP